jgi:multidrug resistance efflux pump
MAENDRTEADSDELSAQSEPPAVDPVRRWTLIITGVVAVLLVWYLVADRLTPFSTQARVKAYVVPIAPQVSGRVIEVKVVNNELVDADQALVMIDPENYRLAVESAQANLESARQSLGAANAAVESAAAGIDAALAQRKKAEQEESRLKRIFKEDPGAVSERRVQSAEASLEAARSKVVQAQANLEQAQQNRGTPGEENSRILTAQAALDQAELDLSRTTIVAPGRGLVTDLAVDRGNYAQPGQPLMTFIAIHDLWIQADMTENNLGHVKPGDAVDFVLDVQPGRVFRGTVRSVGYGVATGDDNLGALPTIDNDPDWLRSAQRFPVVIDFAEGSGEQVLGLRVGSQATVIIYTGENWFTNLLAAAYIRLNSLLTYAY